MFPALLACATHFMPVTDSVSNSLLLQTQLRLVQMRFLGYVGVQLTALLVPLLVFQLTGNVALAGLALFVEWLPKLGFYLTGGTLAQRFGRRRMHLALDGARVLALAGLLVCALEVGNLGVLALSAAAYQCSNALSNILFERSVARWWPLAEQSRGHATLLKSDQWGCLLALVAGLLLGQLWVLALAGLVLQLGATCYVALRGQVLYDNPTQPADAPVPSSLSFWSQFARDLRAARSAPLLRLGAITTLVGVAPAAVFSALAFYLDRAQPGSIQDAHLVALLLLARTVLSLGILQFALGRLRHGADAWALAWPGLVLLVASTAALAAPLPFWGVVTAVVVLGVSFSLYTPLLRQLRQDLIGQVVPAGSRAAVTGMLIATDALSYLVAAGLLALSGRGLVTVSLAAALLALAGTCFLAGNKSRLLVASGV